MAQVADEVKGKLKHLPPQAVPFPFFVIMNCDRGGFHWFSEFFAASIFNAPFNAENDRIRDVREDRIQE